MAHIGEFQLDTKHKYKKLVDVVPNLELIDGTTYTLQARGLVAVQVSDKLPTSGGFIIKDLTLFTYKHETGFDLYIKACEEGSVINIAE